MQEVKRVVSARPVLSGLVALGLMVLVLIVGAAVLPPQSARASNPSGGVGAAQAAPARPDSTSLVISQVYGGGGNSGSLYTNDFIEVFNPQSVPVSVTNWSVQYAAATGGNWAVSVLTGTVTLQPGQYYLVQESQGAGGSQPLPTPDNISSITMSATAGKVALVMTTTALTGICGTNCHANANVVDYVGFGTTATDYEGTGPATAPSSTASDVRLAGGCTDNDNNAADFATANPPTPRNTSSTLNPCGVVGTPTNTATAAPSNTPGGPTLTPTATRTPLPPGPRIHDIQGASHISTYSNTLVSNVQGIVTALRTNGFYMQDPVPDADVATSEGIFVFTSSAPTVAIGDGVAVNGRVTEFRAGGSASTNLTQTEIGTATISLLSSGNPLPTPVVIGTGGRVPPTVIIEDDATGDVETSGVFDPTTDGIDFYESMESMRVQVNNPVATGPTNSFGEIPVLADDGGNGAGVRTTRGGIIIQSTDFNPERVILDDAILSVPSVNVGDHFSGPAVGIMDYNFGNFKLEITQPLTAVSGGLAQEVATPAGPNQIAIGNFNVQNLSPADPPSKFNILASLIITNVKSPDIISVEEIQDNSGPTDDGVVDADVTWNMLITAITNAGGPTYQYRQINPVNDQDGGQPGGNIRQGFLYRTDRSITFVDRAGGCSTCATTVLPGPQGPILSFSPGRVDPTNTAWSSSRKPLAGEFLVNGQRVFVIGNHFNSKGGDQPLFGHFQPPVRSSEIQRHNQAVVVNNFVNQILALDTNANIVVLGDLNDFNFSDTLLTLKGTPSVLNDLVLSLPLPERYTYVYDGNSQDLDHILISNGIAATVPYTFDVVHVNSEFATQASDHEPQVVRLAFPVGGTPTATTTPSGIGTATATSTGTTIPTNTRTSTMTPSGTATFGTPTASRTPSVQPTITGPPTLTNSPTRTPTVLATATSPTQPSQTATVTPQPTACTLQFVDVPPSSTFYDYIRCLVCRGIVGGYPCGGPGEPCPGSYYRPNNNVTRGQTSKIVSESAGFADAVPSTQQTFEDVPPGSTFHLWIERLSVRGIIGGYPCGGPFEPCVSPGNRPYFRPGNNVTRGQLSKITSGAAGWTETPTGQTFEDVAVGSTFYVYIERMASRGIISGYPCGGPFEPCNPPGNRPYFRPNNNATRGQMAKIAASAFFPNCVTPARR